MIDEFVRILESTSALTKIISGRRGGVEGGETRHREGAGRKEVPRKSGFWPDCDEHHHALHHFRRRTREKSDVSRLAEGMDFQDMH